MLGSGAGSTGAGCWRWARTTIWEEYDPRQTFPGHYAMYGDLFGKSLCHAWGAGTIDLIGRYVARFRAEAPGCRAFALEPRPSGLSALDAAIPLPDGGRWLLDRRSCAS